MQELRRRNHSLKDESLRSRTELHCHSHVNMHLIVTDSHLFLALPRQDGTADLENIIISREEKAVEWGRMLFLIPERLTEGGPEHILKGSRPKEPRPARGGGRRTMPGFEEIDMPKKRT